MELISVKGIFIISFVCAILHLDARVFGKFLISQPIFASTITGLILGDYKTGILIGSMLELLYAGNYIIGTSTPMDHCFVSVFTVAFTISSSGNKVISTIIFLSIAFILSFFSEKIEIYIKNINTKFSDLAAVYISGNRIGKINTLVFISLVISFLKEFIFCFFSFIIGIFIFKNMHLMPLNAEKAFFSISPVLQLLSISVILNMFFAKENISIFLLGFLIASFLLIFKLNIVIICFAVIVLLAIAFYKKQDMALKNEK